MCTSSHPPPIRHHHPHSSTTGGTGTGNWASAADERKNEGKQVNISTDQAPGPWPYGLLPPELMLTDRLCVSVNGEGTTHVQPVPANQREGRLKRDVGRRRSPFSRRLTQRRSGASHAISTPFVRHLPELLMKGNNGFILLLDSHNLLSSLCLSLVVNVLLVFVSSSSSSSLLLPPSLPLPPPLLLLLLQRYVVDWAQSTN